MFKHKLKYIILCTALLLGLVVKSQKTFYSKRTTAWQNQQPDSSLKNSYRIFLIGDLKNPSPSNPVLNLLEKQMLKAGEKSAVVVLGDILYQQGMPDSAHVNRQESEKKLEYILSKFDDYRGEIIFIPGNHDWAQGRKLGWDNLKNLELAVEKRLNRGNVFVPDGGCPGPFEIPLTDEIVLIAFDYQWWLHRYNKPHPIYHCDWDEDDNFFELLEEAIERNANKQIIIATHFPLYTVGFHGGYFPLEYSFFPLLEQKKWGYIPLPGFLYTGFRKILGSIQDLAHPEYKLLKEMIWNIVAKHPNVIYSAGHEHNLQYLQKDSIHHIVSGGGGEGSYISRRKRKADFAADSYGYSILDYYENGEVWMKFVRPENDSIRVLFQKKLYTKKVRITDSRDNLKQGISFSDSTIYTALTDIYQADPSRKFWMGQNYRKEWKTKVTYPVFDIGKEKGGLEIIKRGGGQQTTSVRLKDKNGNQYVLRSVNKSVKKAVDKFMQNTFLEDIVQDGISASHPFAAVTIPPLANAVGVYHTNPRLVWLPDDPRFGIYRNAVSNNVFLFEERPDGDARHLPNFGRSKNIVSTSKMIKKIRNSHKHEVDQASVLRARLLDILVNDWDRHEDQWRWATFKEDGKIKYKVIPRDRDQVFFVNQGLLMGIAKQDFLMPKFQGFDHEIKNVNGLGFNSRYFDRSFLNQPSREDWIAEVEHFQIQLTDSVIHEAITKLPHEIYKISGKEIESKLKSRLTRFQKYAEEYYEFLSKNVDVVGTDERDLFKVERQSNGDMKVSVFELSDKKAKVKDLFFQRTFKKDETKEVRLYGLEEKDRFEITGTAPKGIKLRMIGGKGKDHFIDESKISGWSRKNLIYDRSNKKNIFEVGSESRLKLSTKKSVNKYDRMQFKFNKSIPLAFLGYNIDDGIILGGGLNIKRYNFRDSTSHLIIGQYAFETAAFGIKYEGAYSTVFNNSSLKVNAEISMPRNVDNFFGLGNNSIKALNDKHFYTVRHKLVYINPKVEKAIGKQSKWSLGVFYKYTEIRDTATRYVGAAFPETLSANHYGSKNYMGFNAILDLDDRDNKINPVRGIRWHNEAQFYTKVSSGSYSFLKLKSDLSFYLSFKKDPRYVFALKFGGAKNFGEYDFLHANYLGNKKNLRGFLSNRFGGESYLYQNTELRLKLMNIRRHFFVGQWGLLFFNDLGRIWNKIETSSTWHNGYGFGTWISPFNATIINLTYEMSKEERLFTFNLRFSF